MATDADEADRVIASLLKILRGPKGVMGRDERADWGLDGLDVDALLTAMFDEADWDEAYAIIGSAAVKHWENGYACGAQDMYDHCPRCAARGEASDVDTNT